MSVKTKTSPKPSIDSLKLRVLQAKARVPRKFQLRAVYEYVYGKVTDQEWECIRSCWYVKAANAIYTDRFEVLAENINRLPTFETEKAEKA